jgi:hypothetical protein
LKLIHFEKSGTLFTLYFSSLKGSFKITE